MKNPIRQGSMVVLPAGINEIEMTADNYMGGSYEIIEQSGKRERAELSWGPVRRSIDPKGQATINNNTMTTLYWEQTK